MSANQCGSEPQPQNQFRTSNSHETHASLELGQQVRAKEMKRNNQTAIRPRPKACPYQRKKQKAGVQTGEVNESRRWLRLSFRHARDRIYVSDRPITL